MASQEVPQGQELTQEEYVAQAQRQMAQMQEYVMELAEANKALVEGVGDQEYTFTGHANFYMFVFGGKLSAWVNVNDGTKLHFAGEWYGVGWAGGSSWGGGTFGYIPPSEIVGHCTFEAHNAGLGPGALQINWVRGKQILGTYAGGGIGGGSLGAAPVLGTTILTGIKAPPPPRRAAHHPALFFCVSNFR